MKTAFAASITLAIAALTAGQAMAGDAADLVDNLTGMSPRQMFPAHHGVAVALGKTRAEVQAELLAFNANRDSADIKMDIIGMSPRQAFPAQHGVAVAQGKTRDEVRNEYVAYRSSLDSADDIVPQVGMSLRQLFPKQFGIAKVRSVQPVTNLAAL